MWGDGLKTGSEAWDDANTLNSDGCSNDCSKIEVKYIWNGGSTKSKDTWIKWNNGFYPNT